MPAAKWTKESAAKVLAQCHSRREAKKSSESNGAWQWAYKQGLLEELTGHFARERVPRGTWQDIEKCREVLARFRSPSHAKGDNEGATAYRVARENGWLDEITQHWSKRDTLPAGSWTAERCAQVLGQFVTLLQAKADPIGRKAIEASRYLDCYEPATAHMPRPEKADRGYWTKERCQDVLASFSSLAEAEASEQGRKAYNAAKGNGWVQAVTSHFTPSDGGFDPRKPAYTYFLRLTNGAEHIHKVGITNREVLQRVQTLIRRPGTIVEIQGFVKFDIGIKARLMEEELLFRFAEFSLPELEAKRFIGNGFTECFSADIWHLSGITNDVNDITVISGEKLGLWGLSSPSKTKWLIDNAIEAAKACGASRSVLRRKHPSAYNVLREAGILDTHCPMLSRRTITDEELITEIQKHANAKSLRSTPKGESLYITAKNRGLWELASAGMIPLVRRGVTDSKLLGVAERYDSQTLFRKENKAIYDALYNRGLIEAACAHMSQKKINWRNQKDKVLRACQQCRTKSELIRRFPGAAGEARRAGYWEEATAHMAKGSGMPD